MKTDLLRRKYRLTAKERDIILNKLRIGDYEKIGDVHLRFELPDSIVIIDAADLPSGGNDTSAREPDT